MKFLSVTRTPEKALKKNHETADNLEIVRRAVNFQDAIRQTIIWRLLRPSKDQTELVSHFFSKTELSALERIETTQIGLIIDLDGVLLNTKQELIKYLKQLATFRWGSARITVKSAIPHANAKLLLKVARVSNVDTTIMSDRIVISGNAKSFPFIGRDVIVNLTNKHLHFQQDGFKLFQKGTEFLDQINKRQVTYYIGSSDRDHKLFVRIQKTMKDRGVDLEKLIYIEVEHTFRQARPKRTEFSR